MTSIFRLTTMILVLCTAMALRADAQVRYGSIVVEVTDQSGGAVPGADVTVTQTQTGLTRNGVSNEVGLATLATLPPGSYSVKVSLSGFKEFVTSGVNVSEDSVVRVGSVLEVGQLSDTVTVSAGIAALQTDR